MFSQLVVVIVFLVGVTGCTVEPPPENSKYKVEGTATVEPNDTVLVVTVLDVATGKYVPDAEVWHVTTRSGAKGIALQPTTHLLMQDGRDGYKIILPWQEQWHANMYSSQHFMVKIPGESEVIHARIEAPVSK